ncbi:hypothetical protein [Sorangium sp. So ce1151]|uniref:hypothetical protein n=1 Tax=Sorangium sp. So ce1151 TaxID=3133332 RepID=UPI003F63CCD1
MTDGKPSRFFDFFDIRNNGEIIPPTKLEYKVTSGDGKEEVKNQTVRWGHGFVESFESGWSQETTYELYRARIEELLRLASEHSDNDVAVQALLASAIVLTVSGLETLVCAAAKLKQAPRQGIDEFIGSVSGLKGYVAMNKKDRMPLQRMFDARHAIVHYGWRITTDLQGSIDGRSSSGEELLLNVQNVRKVIEAADRFASCVAPCFPSLDL